MQNKSNRVLSLAMSAALMLTNMISPMTAYAEELTEDAAEEYLEVAEPEMIPEPETEAKEYMITLPWYEDIVYTSQPISQTDVFYINGTKNTKASFWSLKNIKSFILNFTLLNKSNHMLSFTLFTYILILLI